MPGNVIIQTVSNWVQAHRKTEGEKQNYLFENKNVTVLANQLQAAINLKASLL